MKYYRAKGVSFRTWILRRGPNGAAVASAVFFPDGRLNRVTGAWTAYAWTTLDADFVRDQSWVEIVGPAGCSAEWDGERLW